MSTKIQFRDNSRIPATLGTQLSPVDMNVRPRIRRRIPRLLLVLYYRSHILLHWYSVFGIVLTLHLHCCYLNVSVHDIQ